MTKEEVEATILSDVVTRFITLKQSTPRRPLLIKFRNSPAAPQAIMNLLNDNVLRRTDAPSNEEEYLPSAAAFEFCSNVELRNRAKMAVTIVLHTLQEMYVGEQPKEGFTVEDLTRHVEHIYPDKNVDAETIKLGLYLAQDFGVLQARRLNPPDNTEVTWFQIGESAITMPNPETQWATVMAKWRSRRVVESAKTVGSRKEREPSWERIDRLGGGGQSNVFLVRAPARVAERERCLQTIRTTQDSDKRAEWAEAIWSYARLESPSELGALKVFKIPPEGKVLTARQREGLERLKKEIAVLGQNRRGLPRLLHSDLKERSIVTEYFPLGTLADHPLRYRGDVSSALKAFRSLVETVALLHKEGYVHRDIKPANVFIAQSGELVLGDFGIVWVPNAEERITLENEKVGPREYMPQWANLGVRYENVESCFDVYMLGKLLWVMVDGRLILPREYHRHANFDLTRTFPNDPSMFLINRILDKCVVEDPQKCLPSAQDLLLMVTAMLTVMERGGQLLSADVPRPCHVCGNGFYEPESLRPNTSHGMIRVWMSGAATDITTLPVQTFTCNNCGHVEFFKTVPG